MDSIKNKYEKKHEDIMKGMVKNSLHLLIELTSLLSLFIILMVAMTHDGTIVLSFNQHGEMMLEGIMLFTFILISVSMFFLSWRRNRGKL